MMDDLLAIAPYADRYRAIETMEIPETIPDLLNRATGLFGDATAIDFFEQGQSMSYAELARTVRRLAHGLHGIGIGHGTHVGVLLPNRVEYPVLWLALAEIGAVMVPIVLGSTLREVSFFLENSDSSFLVTESRLLGEKELEPGIDAIPPAGRILLVGDKVSGFPSYDHLVSTGDPAFRAPNPPSRDDLLSIQHTSGTTGAPKGVMLSHRYWIIMAVTSLSIWGIKIRTLLNDGPFFYMDPQWMLLTGLYEGARVDFADRPSVRKWVGWLHERRTELAWFTSLVLKNPPLPEEKDNAIKLFMGEHLRSAAIAQMTDRFGAPIRECYGMTEIGMGLCMPSDIDDPLLYGSCGVPAPFRRCRIVGPDGEDVGTGETGELCFQGDGLLSGYYKRDDANAAAFTDGWFRTGDIAKRDARGFYWIVGRTKDMIRRSGENVAAAEVEKILAEMPEISQAAVVPVPDERRGEEVKAYIRLAPGLTALAPEAILAHCARKLAPFKIPRFIAFVDEFPYTPSEKIAKHLLVKGIDDLRSDSFDGIDGVWR